VVSVDRSFFYGCVNRVVFSFLFSHHIVTGRKVLKNIYLEKWALFIVQIGRSPLKQFPYYSSSCTLYIASIASVGWVGTVRELMGRVRNVVLINVNLELENPGDRDFG
jgi:hypothetical protein